MYKFESCFLKKTVDKCVRNTSVIVQLFLWNMFYTLFNTKTSDYEQARLTSDKYNYKQVIYVSTAGCVHHLQLCINADREQFFLLITDVVNALSKTLVLWLTHPLSFNSIEWGGFIPLLPASQCNDALDSVYSW